jgi:hypothetical protein
MSPAVLPVTVCGAFEPRSVPGQEGQAPQSPAQLLQSSPASHVPLPHTAQAPQSAAQLEHDSAGSHQPSPQVEHWPQSCGQVEHDSPPLHAKSPQLGAHGVPQTVPTSLTQMLSQAAAQQNESTAQIWASQVPQLASSAGPVWQLSWQTQAPQSASQLEHDSLQSHVPSPQTGQAPQSAAQMSHDSFQSQIPSPQTGQAPQSAAQVEHDSPALHMLSPQTVGHGVPQTVPTSLTQMASHE